MGRRRQAATMKLKSVIFDLREYPLTSSQRLALRISVPLHMKGRDTIVEAMESALRMHMVFVGCEMDHGNLPLRRMGTAQLRELLRLYRSELRGEYADYLKDDDSE